MMALSAFFLLLGVVLVVLLLLRQVFLDLLHVGVAVGGRGEDGGDVERDELGIGGLRLGLERLEELVVLDGVVDRRGGEERVEPAAAGGGVVLGEDGLDDGLLGERLAGLGGVLAFGLVVVDVEAQDVPVLDGVGDGVGVQLAAGRGPWWSAAMPASPSICLTVAFSSKIGVPVKPKSWALGKNSLMALWFSPNCERWHSSKMKTMRLSRSGSSRSL